MASTAALLAAATATRQDALEFASRTLKNLQFLESAREAGADVHVVTQLVNSLLGFVVFPLELRQELFRALKELGKSGSFWGIAPG